MNKTILITGCGGHFMRDTIQCYRDCEDFRLRIIGTASELDEDIAPEVDSYIEVPRSTEKGYVERILSICKKENVDIVIPNVDEEVLEFCKRMDEFTSIGTKLSAPPYEAASKVVDKIEFMQFLEKENICHPKYAVFENKEQIIDAAIKAGYPENPVCVKLSNTAGSRGFRVIDANVDFYSVFAYHKPTSKYMAMSSFLIMLSEVESFPAMLMQEYLPGSEYSVDLLADNGNVMYIVGRENTVCENSVPMESVLRMNREAYKISRMIVEKAGLDGNIGIDFIFDKDGLPVPIEVNARITSAISLCKEGGVNLPLLQVMRLLGMEMPKCMAVKYGMRMKRKRIAFYR